MWDETEQRKWREGTESLPEHDLGALYQAQHCESHKISKLQKAKREGSKSVAICTIPNCVYLWQIHTPKKGLHGETSQMGRVWPYWNQLACQWKDLERNQKKQKGCKMLHCNNSFIIEFYNKLYKFYFSVSKENSLFYPLSALTCGCGRDSVSLICLLSLSLQEPWIPCKERIVDSLSWQTWHKTRPPVTVIE